MRKCHACGTSWDGEGSPAYKASCDSCGAYLHSCKNCRLHDPGAHNECISPTTEWVANREDLNWCDEFDFKRSATEDPRDAPEAGKAGWDRLFENPDPA